MWVQVQLLLHFRSPTLLASAAVYTAQVFFELIGERGRSGAVVLAAAAPGAFRAGSTDTFTFPLLAPRGDLTWLRVGTDGSGLLPGWHLRRAPRPLLNHVAGTLRVPGLGSHGQGFVPGWRKRRVQAYI